MNIKYKIFAYFYNIFKFFKSPKDNNIFFIIDKKSSFHGNIECIKKELDKRSIFDYNYLSKEEYNFENSNIISNIFSLLKFFLIKPFKLAKSKYIFLNDNFFPLAYMNVDKRTIIVQLWHAPGAFKKFGFSVTTDKNTKNLIKLSSSKFNYITITSKNVSKFYEEAFSVNKDKILPFGIPRTDFYFNNKYNNKEKIKRLRKKFETKYPEIIGKKIVLYAPTFRDNEDLNNDISSHFDFNKFNENLGNEYSLFFRSHPKINISTVNKSINVTNYENESELLLITDILITDYSSIMIDYVTLLRPVILYPFDLKYYSSNDRGFYIDYRSVPGLIAKNTSEIVDIIQNIDVDFDINKLKEFVNFQYDYLDDNSSKRIIDFIFNE